MAELAAASADGRPVRLRFTAAEHAHRLARTRAALHGRGLDALLVFAQESHYWLTGFDSSGYVFFQAGLVTADERPTVLLTRRPDLAQARDASLYDDIRIWLNAEDARPAVSIPVHADLPDADTADDGWTMNATHAARARLLAGD